MVKRDNKPKRAATASAATATKLKKKKIREKLRGATDKRKNNKKKKKRKKEMVVCGCGDSRRRLCVSPCRVMSRARQNGTDPSKKPGGCSESVRRGRGSRNTHTHYRL